jgi:hypothetical protein
MIDSEIFTDRVEAEAASLSDEIDDFYKPAIAQLAAKLSAEIVDEILREILVQNGVSEDPQEEEDGAVGVEEGPRK